MDIERAIYAKLIADAGTSALVGARIYPAQGPQSATFPLIIYNEAAQKTLFSLAGVINLNIYSMKLECFASSYLTAKAVKAAVKACLNAFRGDLQSGAVTVRGIFDETSDDGVETPIHADEMGIFRAGIDLTIHYGLN